MNVSTSGLHTRVIHAIQNADQPVRAVADHALQAIAVLRRLNLLARIAG